MLGWSGKAQTDFLPILLLSINILACVLEHNPRQMWEEDFTHMVINFENLFHWDVWFIFSYYLSVACKHLNNWRNWAIYTAYKSTYFIKCSWSSEAMNTQVLMVRGSLLLAPWRVHRSVCAYKHPVNCISCSLCVTQGGLDLMCKGWHFLVAEKKADSMIKEMIWLLEA